MPQAITAKAHPQTVLYAQRDLGVVLQLCLATARQGHTVTREMAAVPTVKQVGCHDSGYYDDNSCHGDKIPPTVLVVMACSQTATPCQHNTSSTMAQELKILK